MSKIWKIVLSGVVFFVIVAATLAVTYILDFVTLDELKDYASKTGLVVFVVAIASIVISAVVGANKEK